MKEIIRRVRDGAAENLSQIVKATKAQAKMVRRERGWGSSCDTVTLCCLLRDGL